MGTNYWSNGALREAITGLRLSYSHRVVGPPDRAGSAAGGPNGITEGGAFVAPRCEGSAMDCRMVNGSSPPIGTKKRLKG
jgi:hypothetical protein